MEKLCEKIKGGNNSQEGRPRIFFKQNFMPNLTIKEEEKIKKAKENKENEKERRAHYEEVRKRNRKNKTYNLCHKFLHVVDNMQEAYNEIIEESHNKKNGGGK